MIGFLLGIFLALIASVTGTWWMLRLMISPNRPEKWGGRYYPCSRWEWGLREIKAADSSVAIKNNHQQHPTADCMFKVFPRSTCGSPCSAPVEVTSHPSKPEGASLLEHHNQPHSRSWMMQEAWEGREQQHCHLLWRHGEYFSFINGSFLSPKASYTAIFSLRIIFPLNFESWEAKHALSGAQQ